MSDRYAHNGIASICMYLKTTPTIYATNPNGHSTLLLEVCYRIYGKSLLLYYSSTTRFIVLHSH